MTAHVTFELFCSAFAAGPLGTNVPAFRQPDDYSRQKTEAQVISLLSRLRRILLTFPIPKLN